jgi:ribosome-associated protein
MNLDQFLKWSGVTPTGGQAKLLIQAGEVRVNGETEGRRGRKLMPGDRVEVQGQTLVVPELPESAADAGAPEP